MKIAEIDKDYIVINEQNMYDYKKDETRKIHLIKLTFKNPTKEKIYQIFDVFFNTKRFIIEDNIKFYNYIFRTTRRKYYVENKKEDDLITFFKRNNKVLLNINSLTKENKNYILNTNLTGILKNIEVIFININDYEKYKDKFINWNGNIILER